MRADSVNLSEYREDWPERFEVAAQDLALRLDDAYAIEHVGSTAVPGLAAKNCIDILVIAPSRDLLAVATPLIESAGFEYRPSAFPDEPPHRFFRRVEAGVRTHHVHLLSIENPEIDEYLALRALLRSDATARTEYEAVKVRLASASPDDRAAYIEGKAEVVVALTKRALTRWPTRPESSPTRL